jgi:hypothetical protein
MYYLLGIPIAILSGFFIIKVMIYYKNSPVGAARTACVGIFAGQRAFPQNLLKSRASPRGFI